MVGHLCCTLILAVESQTLSWDFSRMWVSSCPCPAVGTVFLGASGMWEVGNPEGEREPEMCLCLCETDGGHFWKEF